VDIQVNGQCARISVWMSAPSDHLHGCLYEYPCGCPCRIIRTTDSSTREKASFELFSQVPCSFRQSPQENSPISFSANPQNEREISSKSIFQFPIKKFSKRKNFFRQTKLMFVYESDACFLYKFPGYYY